MLLTYLYRDYNMTDKEVAAALDISIRSYHNWKKKSPTIKAAISLGKVITDTRVENVLLKKALEGDLRAIELWLRNRKRDKWTNSGPSIEVVQPSEGTEGANAANNQYEEFTVEELRQLLALEGANEDEKED